MLESTKLIFLLSQPRSGSTLTQRILSTHSKIDTLQEPWIMLHPLYALKNEGIETEYNHMISKTALELFIDKLPKKRDTYYKEISRYLLNIYSLIAKKEFFLDKTPRYYLILDELLNVFPDSKYIFLIRNPLSVLGSIINTWVKNDWMRLKEYESDLKKCLDVYIKHIDNKAVYKIRYENLIKSTETEMHNLLNFLGLKYETNQKEQNFENKEGWVFGDNKIYEKNGIEANNDSVWKENLVDAQYNEILFGYLNYIGRERYEKLGYDFDENMKWIINARKKRNQKNLITFTDIFAISKTEESSIQYLKAEIESLKKDIQTNKEKLIRKNKKYRKLLKTYDELYLEFSGITSSYLDYEKADYLNKFSTLRKLLDKIKSNKY